MPLEAKDLCLPPLILFSIEFMGGGEGAVICLAGSWIHLLFLKGVEDEALLPTLAWMNYLAIWGMGVQIKKNKL
jgi:hypothetical protein